MMNLLVTGATGFIGRMVIAALSGRRTVRCNGEEYPIGHILAADLAPHALAELASADSRIVPVAGSYASPENLSIVRDYAPGLVIHLASVVSAAAEAEYGLGVSVNLEGLIGLTSLCQSLDVAPVFVFASSVAVFSAEGNGVLSDTDVPRPLSSYGTQKYVGELLIRDLSRRGGLHGRSIRFPTIAVRPGAPNKAASSFVSGIIREPLAGQPAVLPVDPSVRIHLASPDAALAAILHAAALPQAALGAETTITLPGLSVSVAEMIATLREIAGDDVAGRIRSEPNPAIAAIVQSWPGALATPRAEGLGFAADASFAEVVRSHIARFGIVR